MNVYHPAGAVLSLSSNPLKSFPFIPAFHDQMRFPLELDSMSDQYLALTVVRLLNRPMNLWYIIST